MKQDILKISRLLLIIGISSIVWACGKKEDNSLAGQKSRLAELKKEQSSLATEIKTLETSIEKLSPIKVEKVKNVVVETVNREIFQHFVEATGRVEAENNQFVGPQTGGAITKVYVKEGDYIAKGQRIATIDNSILRNSMMEVQIQLETAKTLFERQKNLWDQKIGTEIQLIQARSAVESLEKRLATLRSQDALNVVVAPLSGYIDEVRMKAGEMASPGLGIVRIVNSSNLKVTANVPDTYAGTINKGNGVQISFPDIQKSVNASLNFVSQTVNPVSRTFVVEARIPTSDKQFKPNLAAKLLINDISKSNSVIIPENYILNTENGKLVYVAVEEGKNKVARSREVKTGLSYNGKVEVISGLQAGDKIITEGYQDLVDGQLINY